MHFWDKTNPLNCTEYLQIIFQKGSEEKVPETVLKGGGGGLLVCSVLAALQFIYETDFLWFWLMPGLLLPVWNSRSALLK